MINQQTIADRLGISRTSVSRSFSNHPAVNPETRARVLGMAAQLGYRYTPLRGAGGRAEAGTGTIGVLVAGAESITEAITEETCRYMLTGVSERLRELGMAMDVRYLDTLRPEMQALGQRPIKDVHGRKWEGAVLIYPFPGPGVERLAAAMPCVALVEDYAQAGVDCIDTDHAWAIGRLVQHLHELGHRRIGFFTWHYPVPTPWAQRRFGAYVEGLARLDLSFEVAQTVNAWPGRPVPISACGTAVAQHVRQGVTAWVCAADHQAYTLIAELRKLGLRVPEDCAVTGFDGVVPPLGEMQLTSVRVPYRDMGVTAVTRLLGRRAVMSSPRRHILLSPEFLVGETTGPVGGARA